MSIIINEAHDKLYELMNAEFPSQTANYNTVAAMILPSVTVQAVSEDENNEGWSNDILMRHLINVSIRVHTSFVGFARNNPAARAYVDHIITQVRSNIDLGDGYRVLEFKVSSMDTEFDDSKTRGAEIVVTVLKVERHTQV